MSFVILVSLSRRLSPFLPHKYTHAGQGLRKDKKTHAIVGYVCVSFIAIDVTPSRLILVFVMLLCLSSRLSVHGLILPAFVPALLFLLSVILTFVPALLFLLSVIIPCWDSLYYARSILWPFSLDVTRANKGKKGCCTWNSGRRWRMGTLIIPCWDLHPFPSTLSG